MQCFSSFVFCYTGRKLLVTSEGNLVTRTSEGNLVTRTSEITVDRNKKHDEWWLDKKDLAKYRHEKVYEMLSKNEIFLKVMVNSWFYKDISAQRWLISRDMWRQCKSFNNV